MKLFEIDNCNGLAVYVVAITMENALKHYRNKVDDGNSGLDLMVNEVVIEEMPAGVLGLMRYETKEN